MPVARTAGSRLSGDIADGEARQAMDQWVSVLADKILPAVAAVYLLISAQRLFLKVSEASNILNWLAFATGLASLTLWILLRQKRIAPNRVQRALLLIGAMIVIRSLGEFHRTADGTQAVIIVLLLIGSANMLFDRTGFDFLAILSIAGWAAFVPPTAGLPSLIFWSAVILSTVAISRLRIGVRISNFHLAQKARRTEIERAEKERVHHEHLDLAVRGAEDGLWHWDLKSGTFEVSPSWAAMLGYTRNELEASVDEWFNRIHPGYLEVVTNQISIHLHGESDQFRSEHRLRRRDGTYLWVLARGSVVRDESGEPVTLAGTIADITSVIEVEGRVLEDSFHDKLTGLPNRAFLVSCVKKRIAQQRERGHRTPSFAVMFLDLDRFKVINDSLGHPAGDQLLREVASRLQNGARPGDIVSRFGGDEFVILLERIQDPEEALNIGNRLRNALSTPFQLAGREVVIGASIGIALNNGQLESTDDLLRFADIAMYRAKSNGKGQVQLFSPEMHSYATKLCDLQNDLRQAVDRQQLVLHYQPSFSISSGKILGVEALLRWQRSDNELLFPDDFIPLAEETGLITDIGEWALRSACTQNAAWQKAGIPPVRMAVNLSARQLRQKGFSQTVHRILGETNLPADWLELELTETALISALDHAPKAFEDLGALGVRIAIDDFGTGYSSLNYLRQFSFSTLKMDRCFVSDVATDGKSAAVAKGVIALAHNLNLSVVAEGVEREAQLSFLAANRCDQAQGFLASRPVCAEQLVDLLQLGHVKQVFDYDFESAADLNRLAYHARDLRPDHDAIHAA